MLTNTQVRDAKPRATRYELTCDALPGFILRVLPTGKKVFFVRFRDADGKDHRHRLGLVSPGFGADEARREAMVILGRREAPKRADTPETPAPRAPATQTTPASQAGHVSAPHAEPEARTEHAPSRHAVHAASRSEPSPVPRSTRAAPRSEHATVPRSTRAAPRSEHATVPRSTRAPSRSEHASASAPPRAIRRAAPTRDDDAHASRVHRLCPTLRQFAVRFEQDHIDVRLKPGSADHYRSILQLHILPALGAKRLDDITTTDIQRLHNSLRSTPSAANLARSVLSAIFTKAELWEVTTRRNPVRGIPRFEERAVERYLSPDERRALEQVLIHAEHVPAGRKGHVGQENIWAIRLLMLSGMRRDEVRDLRWEQVDWRQSVLHLPDSKTGKRDVVVSDEFMRLLATIAAAKGKPRRGLVVCSNTGNKLHGLGRSWETVRAAADLADVRLHDLRHSVASDAIMDGIPLHVVGKMLGHRNYRTTERYAHIADTVLRDAVNRTSRVIVHASRGEVSDASASDETLQRRR